MPLPGLLWQSDVLAFCVLTDRHQLLLGCNTPANQMLLIESTSSTTTNFFNILATTYPLQIFQLQALANTLPNVSVPLDATSAVLLWEVMLQYVVYLFRQATSTGAQQFYTPAIYLHLAFNTVSFN